MPDRSGHRPRYPRSARVNELMREVLAEEIERLAVGDDRVGILTITAVSVDPDLRHAKVLLASMPEPAQEALEEARVRLQRSVGRQVRMKRTPQLSFSVDPAITTGQRVDEILRGLQHESVRAEDREDGDHRD
jgi:ribosome-binding factor A